ncbi:FMN reductase [Hyphomicrobium sp. MC1]|uniref:FMN reductase n=1 Tax=Hyphomicrobium sp. (strain MC1) TaxID=717785 RepID=UPI000213F81D|nr:FMN reductase [Hyphomicrobium sp. MC1]CCB63377.1 NAD(P)H-dependent FMN reductase [Hyphomicrobium sp. MC1]
MSISVVGISGSLSEPSRTSGLVSAILEAIARETNLDTIQIDLSTSSAGLFAASSPAKLNSEARAIVEPVEDADLLVVGSPVYRASYTGALKHLFDLVDHKRFASKPVILAATGGSPLHGLVIEHQLRPLFGFLNALTLPTAIYAIESDFSNYRLTNDAVRERIDRSVAEAVIQLTRHRIPKSFSSSVGAASNA